MTETAETLISDALALLGVLAGGQTASARQGAHGLTVLNRMVNSWEIDKLTILAILRTVKALTANTQRYTIGSGGDIDIVRPNWIDDAKIIPDSSLAAAQRTELPCALFTAERWAAIVVKSLTSSYPAGIYYDHAYSSSTDRGNIDTWPIQTGANVQLVLYTPQALTQFADLSTSYRFAPGYAEALLYNLAKKLAPAYGRQLDEDLREDARATKAAIAVANLTIRELRVDAAILGVGGYDIRSGGTY